MEVNCPHIVRVVRPVRFGRTTFRDEIRWSTARARSGGSGITGSWARRTRHSQERTCGSRPRDGVLASGVQPFPASPRPFSQPAWCSAGPLKFSSPHEDAREHRCTTGEGACDRVRRGSKDGHSMLSNSTSWNDRLQEEMRNRFISREIHRSRGVGSDFALPSSERGPRSSRGRQQ